MLPGTNNIPILRDIKDGKTETESALCIALRFEEQTELWDLGTMIAPQNMYTTIWFNVKATKGIGVPSTVCSRKACIDVWSCDFSLLVGPGPSKNIAGQVPKRHPWRGRCSNYKNELDMFSGSWRDEYQFVHLDSWREEQFEHLNISTASPWLDIRGLDPWINYLNWYGRKNRCLRSVRRKPMFFIYVDRWCPPERWKESTPSVYRLVPVEISYNKEDITCHTEYPTRLHGTQYGIVFFLNHNTASPSIETNACSVM